MFLLALSAIFGYGIVFERMPEVISDCDPRHHRQPERRDGADRLFILLVAGSFIEGSVLIIMLTPIFLPLVRDLRRRPGAFRAGVHHRGDHRQLHAAGRRRDVRGLLRSCAARSANIRANSTPFLIAVSVVTLLLIFVPEVVLIVPDLIFGKDMR